MKRTANRRGYDPIVGDKICASIATGRISLRTICKREGMPCVETVLRWLREDCDGFAALYARAKGEQSELMVEDMLEIADDGRNDTQIDEKGNEVVNSDVIQRSKLRIDTRKWLVAKLLPKKYGDTAQTNVTVGTTVNAVPQISLVMPASFVQRRGQNASSN